MTRLHRWWLPALLASALTVAACGDDDETPRGDGGTDGGVDGGIDAGRDAAADAAIDASAQPVTCGTATCQAYPPLSGFTATPCCYSAATSTCSGSVAAFGNMCLRPAVNDTACPTVVMQGVPAPGCCASSGKCGINGNLLGFGCVDLSVPTIRALVMAGLDGGTLPASTSCTPADGGV